MSDEDKDAQIRRLEGVIRALRGQHAWLSDNFDNVCDQRDALARELKELKEGLR